MNRTKVRLPTDVRTFEDKRWLRELGKANRVLIGSVSKALTREDKRWLRELAKSASKHVSSRHRFNPCAHYWKIHRRGQGQTGM